MRGLGKGQKLRSLVTCDTHWLLTLATAAIGSLYLIIAHCSSHYSIRNIDYDVDYRQCMTVYYMPHIATYGVLMALVFHSQIGFEGARE